MNDNIKFVLLLVVLCIALCTTGTIGTLSNKHTHISHTNESVLNEKIKKLENEIRYLRNKLSMIEAQNTQLEIENSKLKNELNNTNAWNAHEIMDAFYMYRLTPQGKKYDLLFHVGGMGGVAVYQYVGPWQGDAGKWRQYKQIAELSTKPGKEGYIKPGVVIHPIWGFENKTIVIRSMSDIIRLERSLNNINGIIKYFYFVAHKYKQATNYNTVGILAIGAVCAMFGTIFGEVSQPIRSIADRITTAVMTDFGDKKKSRFDYVSIFALIVLFIIVLAWSGDFGLSVVVSAVIAGIVFGVRRML